MAHTLCSLSFVLVCFLCCVDHVNQMDSNVHGYVLSLLQLLLTAAIALVTAAAMYGVSHLVEYFNGLRVETTLGLVREGMDYGAYFALLGISLLLAGISTCLVVFLAPQAKGGGVPYVQAYLNGTNVASYFSLRIVLVKIAALGFTISSGLSLGMEGPFVFIGSGIAIILNKSLEPLSFHQRLGGRYARILKNINEERVFMAGGMAAGLAVAFNAPIAGVLMALEGSTAFLTVPVVIRIFGCAMFATFFNDLGHANFSRNIKTHNLISITSNADAPDYAWVLWEIFAFALIAVIGGLLGALAIWINVAVTKYRHHHVEPHPPKNALNTGFAVWEVLTITFATATAWFVLPYVFGCREVHEQCFPTLTIPMRCQPVQCPDKFYSEIGTIIYSSSDTIARILFDRTLLTENDISPFPLMVYASFYICFVAVVYGAHVPGGLFVPSVVVGGAMGRVVGWFVHAYVSAGVNPGVYALLGAASMFGGFTRLALPAVVMLTEMTGLENTQNKDTGMRCSLLAAAGCWSLLLLIRLLCLLLFFLLSCLNPTGDATYLLPIMFCTVLAKVVSDVVQPPLYPQHMAIEGIPTLGDKLNPLIAPLSAKHIMQRKYHSVFQLDTLDHILSVLDQSRSMLLPVITADGKFVGMIMRRSVIYALKYTKLYRDLDEFNADQQEGPDAARDAPTVTGGAGPQQRRAVSSMLEVEKKMGDVRDTTVVTDYGGHSAGGLGQDKFDDKFATYLINLAPLMDAGALTAHEETSAKRVAAIFRRVGISHLGVSDANNKLVGIITRRHLIKPPATLPVLPSSAAGGAGSGGAAGVHMLSSAQHSVAQLLASGDVHASPDAVLDLQEYDAAQDFEQSAMDQNIALQQSRAAAAAAAAQSSRLTRRNSLLGGAEPAVRFDDEEDEAPSEAGDFVIAQEPQDEDEDEDAKASDAGILATPWGPPQLYDEEQDEGEELNRSSASTGSSAGGVGVQSRAFREATGLAIPTTPSSINTSSTGATPRTRKSRQESSLARLNQYTKLA